MAKKESYKLQIIAYSKNTFADGDKVGEYTVRYNPAAIEHTYDIEYDDSQAVGSSGSESKYRYSKPEKISFELIFDHTIKADGSDDKYKVHEDIKKFKELLIDYNGDIHRPNYLRLAWGDLAFKGQLAEFSISYMAFYAEGLPLRAKASVSFLEVTDVKSRLASENKSSPDLTHIITLKEGDTLPGLCNKIYGDPSYYIEVARMNELDSFRRLKAGDRIIMPPLDR